MGGAAAGGGAGGGGDAVGRQQGGAVLVVCRAVRVAAGCRGGWLHAERRRAGRAYMRCEFNGLPVHGPHTNRAMGGVGLACAL